jgi:hypothetical protein
MLKYMCYYTFSLGKPGWYPPGTWVGNKPVRCAMHHVTNVANSGAHPAGSQGGGSTGTAGLAILAAVILYVVYKYLKGK